MPGTIIFKPIEANLTRDLDLIGKMDPYCLFIIENRKYKGQVCKSGGTHPYWNDTVAIPRTSQPTCLLELRDKDKILTSDTIGGCEVNLEEIETCGKLSKWYPIVHSKKLAGQILIESTFLPETALSLAEEADVQSPVLKSQTNYNTSTLGTDQTLQQQPTEKYPTSLNQPEEFETNIITTKVITIEKQLPEGFSNQNFNVPLTTSTTYTDPKPLLRKFPQDTKMTTEEPLEVKPSQEIYESLAGRGLAKAWGNRDHTLKGDIGGPISEEGSGVQNLNSGNEGHPIGNIYQKH